MPRINVALGVAPENAQLYTDETESAIRAAFADKHVKAIGSCGLALSGNPANESLPPLELQIQVFERQIALARELGVPLIVQADGAWDVAFQTLEKAGLPEAPVILRAQGATADDVAPWIEAGSYIAFDAQAEYDPVGACKLARLVPTDRVLVESGAPENGLLGLTGSDPRCDQVVFIADVLQGVCPGPRLMENFLLAFMKK